MMRRAVLISFLLTVATVAAYWPIRHAQFLNFDDAQYVTNNPKVFHGLTREGFVWAFTSSYASNWHPLTWLSHMLDCEVFGDNPSGHHLVNLGLHAVNAVLLFLLLWRMTGAQARSGFVAALFALHPLHVESVAWIAERKDVLSTLFGLLTMWAYVRYVRELAGQRRAVGKFYGVSLILFGLGLLSKPMLVTIPFLFLLLDFWPLGRIQSGAKWLETKTLMPLLREKVPFFLMAAASAAITFWAQKHGGAMVKMDIIPTEVRVANAFFSYVWYLSKAFWPTGLGAYYAYPKELLLEPAMAAGVLILAITIAVLWWVRRAPGSFVGWFWFLGTLVPVIGFVQVGSQVRADRYTYLPLVGIFIMVTWGGCDLLTRWRYGKAVLAGTGVSILAACLLATPFQVQYWKDGVSLFERAVAVSPENNALAYHNLGNALSLQGNQREAIRRFRQALQIHPAYPEAYYNIGNALGVESKLDEAIANYGEAIRIKPNYAEAHYNLGKALALQGRASEAEQSFLNALRSKPDYGNAMTRLGNLMLLQGEEEKGMSRLFEAVRIEPDNAEAHYYLAAALARKRRFVEAVSHFRAAMEHQPKYVGAMNDLAWILATQNDIAIRNVPEAITLAKRACELTRNQNPMYLDTLGVALSEAGEFDGAVKVTERAVHLIESSADQNLHPQLVAHLNAFRARRPYHEAFPHDEDRGK